MQQRYSTLQYFLSILAIIIACFYASPNLYGETPTIEVTRASDASLPADITTTIKDVLTKEHITYETELKDNKLLLEFKDSDTQIAARDLIAKQLPDYINLALNLNSKIPAWMEMIGAKPMKLGLDLRGGIHFLLNVDLSSLIKTRINSDIKSLKLDLRSDKIRYLEAKQKDTRDISIVLRTAEDTAGASKIARQLLNGYKIKIDDNKILAHLTDDSVAAISNYAIDKTITTLNNRVNELGVSEAVIQRQGMDNISVDLPGIQDIAKAKELLGKTATLRFHLVNESYDPNAKTNPIGTKLYYFNNAAILLNNEAILTGSSITFAQESMQDGMPAVEIKLGGGGESKFHSTTAKNIGKRLAVVYVDTKAEKNFVDGKWIVKHTPHEKIINVAVIRSALGNSFQVTGMSSREEAQTLSMLLRSGALAAPVDIVQETTVGPSLGLANIEKGMLSLNVGCLLVIIFMLCYYRFFGFVADCALILNVIFIIAILSIIGATLTLPGIAGIVLTVGMAVDANVLINERIREELRNNTHPKAAINAGYDKAFTTIMDANVTTLIVAMVLFGLGSGSIKGFAVTLTIGLLVSMLTAIFFTRIVITYFYAGRDNLTKLSIGI